MTSKGVCSVRSTWGKSGVREVEDGTFLCIEMGKIFEARLKHIFNVSQFKLGLSYFLHPFCFFSIPRGYLVRFNQMNSKKCNTLMLIFSSRIYAIVSIFVIVKQSTFFFSLRESRKVLYK